MTSLVLLLVRVMLVITFTKEASIKLKDIKGFAQNDGLPLSLAYCVTIAELCAVLSMASGVLAQWAGVGIMLLMIITCSLHIGKWHSPYWASQRGWEYDLLLLVLASVIIVFGAGQFSIMSFV